MEPVVELGEAAEGAEGDGGPVRRTPRAVSVNGVVAWLLVAVAVRIGLRPIGDNSFFTHLATGRLILHDHRVPTADPYSFSANGEPWTVQSWLASVVYASVERLADFTGLRVLVTALVLGLVLSVWRFTRPASGVVARILVVAFVIVVGLGVWSERPLLFGLVGLALVLRAAQGDLDPRWLVPVMWVWTNTHGSFPFGPGVLVLLVLGGLFDRAPTGTERRALGWSLVGVAVSLVNPLGWRLLVFPLSTLDRSEAFGLVIEWMPMQLDRWFAWAFVAQVVVSLCLVLARDRRWRSILPILVFTAAAVFSQRNIAQASIVVAFASVPATIGLGRIEGDRRRAIHRPVAAVLAVFAALLAVAGLTGPDVDLSVYPVEEFRWADERGTIDRDARVLTVDYVGNFLEAAYGPERVRVYLDDRVDMYPLPVIRDYVHLLRGAPPETYARVLDRVAPTLIVWPADNDFSRWLAGADGWEIVHRSDGWVVAEPGE